ncbi:Hypothetical protein, putative [Bodo saltans]|nr:Hypothetical protein, putative [Bodo saltans]|eukprot:CUG93123.1 Hypothetical protein, putative [Bodo saltans]
MKVFFVGDEETKVNSKTQEVEWWKDHKDLAALAKNQGSKLATLGYLCTYFNSKWAAAEVELPIAKFTPVSMSIQSPGTTGGAPSSKSSSDAFVAAASAGTAAINGAVASTASSWMGYLGSWIGTASASAPPPPPPKVAPPPSLTPELSLTSTTRSDLAEYAPTNLEELCVVWWEHPISKFIINEANGGDQTGRARAYSQGGTARGSAVHDKLCYFYCEFRGAVRCVVGAPDQQVHYQRSERRRSDRPCKSLQPRWHGARRDRISGTRQVVLLLLR